MGVLIRTMPEFDRLVQLPKRTVSPRQLYRVNLCGNIQFWSNDVSSHDAILPPKIKDHSCTLHSFEWDTRDSIIRKQRSKPNFVIVLTKFGYLKTALAGLCVTPETLSNYILVLEWHAIRMYSQQSLELCIVLHCIVLRFNFKIPLRTNYFSVD